MSARSYDLPPDWRALMLQKRAQLDWSQAKLATFLGINRITVANWERAKHEPTGLCRRRLRIWLVDEFPTLLRIEDAQRPKGAT